MRKVLVQGPMKGTYSLAIVNRNIVKRLRKFCDLYILPDESDCGYDEYFRSDGLIDVLEKGNPGNYDFHLKNTWPPTTSDMNGEINAYINFAWEETRFPKEYVDGFNSNLDFITVTSDFTAKSLMSSGVEIPIINTGNGIEEFDTEEKYDCSNQVSDFFPQDILNYESRFLHVSSGFWRKGIDVLIESFLSVFSNSSGACLIIKTFSNPDSIVQKELEKIPIDLRKNIFVISDDLSKAEINILYKMATCIALPSRGEGFSLPAAEALALGKPLITTRFSGALDFCNDRNSLLVDFKAIRSRTHLACSGSLIADPDILDLADKFRRVGRGSSVHPSTSEQNLIRQVFSWDRAVRRTIYSSILAQKNHRRAEISVITTWNQRCGLAEYSKNMVASLNHKGMNVNIIAPKIAKSEIIYNDEDFVERLWSTDSSSDPIYRNILLQNRDKLFILQHHMAYFSKEVTINFIRQCVALGVHTLIIAHNARDWPSSFPTDVMCSEQYVTIVVHDEKDQEHLISIGFRDVHLFEHPIVEYQEEEYQPRIIETDPHLTSFGFMMPHKGFQDIIHAMSFIKDDFPGIKLTLLSATQNNIKSKVTYYNILDLISFYGLEKNVRIDTAFLDSRQVNSVLKSSDLTILPYHNSNEGASGALRTCITAGVPLLISSSEIFSNAPRDFARFTSGDPIDLAIKISSCIKNRYQRKQMSQSSISTSKSRSWSSLIPEIEGLIRHKKYIKYHNLTEADQHLMRR